MRLKFFSLQKPHVIGRHDRACSFSRQRHSGMHVILLVRSACALKFNIEAVGKRRLPELKCRTCIGIAPIKESLSDIALLASRQRDHALCVLSDPFLLYSRATEILSLLIRARQQ